MHTHMHTHIHAHTHTHTHTHTTTTQVQVPTSRNTRKSIYKHIRQGGTVVHVVVLFNLALCGAW